MFLLADVNRKRHATAAPCSPSNKPIDIKLKQRVDERAVGYRAQPKLHSPRVGQKKSTATPRRHFRKHSSASTQAVQPKPSPSINSQPQPPAQNGNKVLPRAPPPHIPLPRRLGHAVRPRRTRAGNPHRRPRRAEPPDKHLLRRRPARLARALDNPLHATPLPRAAKPRHRHPVAHLPPLHGLRPVQAPAARDGHRTAGRMDPRGRRSRRERDDPSAEEGRRARQEPAGDVLAVPELRAGRRAGGAGLGAGQRGGELCVDRHGESTGHCVRNCFAGKGCHGERRP